MILAYLRLIADESEFPFNQWAAIAKEQGIDFKYPFAGKGYEFLLEGLDETPATR